MPLIRAGWCKSTVVGSEPFEMINKKHLLIGCSAATVAAVAVLGVAAYLVYRALRDPFRTISHVPAELQQTGVVLGEGLLTKQVFSSDRRLSQVRALAFGPVEPGEPDEVCSVSGFGALFLDATGTTKRYVPYGMQQVKMFGMKLQSAGTRISRFQIIDLGGTGECSFLARDGAMGAELIGHDGKPVWQLRGGLDFRSNASDTIAGDLYGDGKTEFVASFYLGDKGVALYDASLNAIWSKPEIRAYHVELVDSENGKKDIACSESHSIQLLDAQGNLLRKLQINSYFDNFMILTWPPDVGSQYAVCHDDDNVDLYDLSGRLVFRCEVRNGRHLNRFTALGFMAGRIPYLAIVGSSGPGGSRSIFSVYGLPEHALLNQTVRQSPLYQEVLAESCEAISKLPADDSGSESILIGGYGRILRYSPGSLPTEPPKKPKAKRN
jgi:hypothetical protein